MFSIQHARRRSYVQFSLQTLMLLMMVVALALVWWKDQVPEAQAILRVRRENGDRNSYDRYRETQTQLITSPYVLSAALRNPAVADQNVARAARNVVVKDPLALAPVWSRPGRKI